MEELLNELIKKEGWTLHGKGPDRHIILYGEKFPYTHPCMIHLKIYRTSKNPEIKYLHMKAAHDYLWPGEVWHFWTEKRFRRHCGSWKFITHAGGASTTKSYDMGKLAVLWWLADPKHRAVVVASTTLEAIKGRIWGYILKMLNSISLSIPFKVFEGNSPKVLYMGEDRKKDPLHGMFAVAAQAPSSSGKSSSVEDQKIRNWIGRHPDNGLLVILDEATDLPVSILNAVSNLDAKGWFQMHSIGNSASKDDLHGALATPKNGWKSIDPFKDDEWETQQPDGLCLFYSCYASPAILEKDPVLRAKYETIFRSAEAVREQEIRLGKTSNNFYRFVLGFWQDRSLEEKVLSENFLEKYLVRSKTEWLGLRPLNMVGGLDSAFSTGGDKCILRLAQLGVAANGQVVLDYKDTTLLFELKIEADSLDPTEMQIAKQALKILRAYRVPLDQVCIDSNGQGRALGSVLHLLALQSTPEEKRQFDFGMAQPLKIYSVRRGQKSVNSFDVIIKTAHELWFTLRDYIQNMQIKGLDNVTVEQLQFRKVSFIGKNNEAILETKQEFKARMQAKNPKLAHSPDEADGAALALQAAIVKFQFYPGQMIEIPRPQTFEDMKMYLHQEEVRMVSEKEASEEAPPAADFSGDITLVAEYSRDFN